MSVRVADVHLRGIRARVYRPAAPAPALVVLLGDGDGTELCSRTGFVVLAASCVRADDATAVLEWAADHAAELGAEPGRLLLAGGVLAADVARRVSANGWPEIQLMEGTES
jgi:acetyl esterase/lipase